MIRLRSRCKSLVTVLGRKRTDVIDVYQPGDCFIHKYSDYDGQIFKALDARIVETTVEQNSNKKQKRKELIYLKKPIRLERDTFYLIKSKDVHPNRFRLNRYQKASSERIFDLAEKSELLPFDPFLDEEWNGEEYFKEKFGDLLDTLEARAQGGLVTPLIDVFTFENSSFKIQIIPRYIGAFDGRLGMKVQNFKENKNPTAIKKSKYLKNHFDEINVWDVTIRIKYKFQMKIKLSKLSYSLNCISEDDHPEIVRATLEPKTADYSIGNQFDYSKPLTLCSSNHHFAQFQSRVQHVSDNFYLQGQIEYLNQTRDLKQTVPLPLVEFSLDQVSLE